jgi:hypothetical protein
LSRQYGILNILQPYRPPRSVTGIALLTFLLENNRLCTGSNQLRIRFSGGLLYLLIHEGTDSSSGCRVVPNFMRVLVFPILILAKEGPRVFSSSKYESDYGDF